MTSQTNWNFHFSLFLLQTEARKWVASSGWPSWSAAITQVDTVGEYISEHLYDKLIWLSKPYAGYILSMGVVILYMVVIVMIVMSIFL